MLIDARGLSCPQPLLMVYPHLQGAESIDMLCQCGFDEADARKALTPLVTGNVQHVLTQPLVAARRGEYAAHEVIA